MRPCNAAVVVLFVLFCALAVAQSPKNNDVPDQKTSFRSSSRLVLVPVLVHSKHGGHIPGLKKEAFSVRENGKEQKIAFFEEVSGGTLDARKKVAPAVLPGEYTNQTSTPERPVVIVAIDRINTPAVNQLHVRRELIKFLADTIRPGTLVAIVTMDRGGIQVIHDFTSDSSILVATLKELKARLSATELQRDPLAEQMVYDVLTSGPDGKRLAKQLLLSLYAENARDQKNAVDLTLAALEQLARAYEGIPGRKAVIWATAGFPFHIVDVNNSLLRDAANQTIDNYADITSNYQRTWTLLSDANIALYPVDTRGLVNPDMFGTGVSSTSYVRRSLEQMWDTGNTQISQALDCSATMRAFAGATGGREFLNPGDMVHSFDQAAGDSASLYMLGYYLDRRAKPGWHALKVQVKADAEVRARAGFLFNAAPPKEAAESELSLALASPLNFSGLAVTVRWTSQTATADGKHRIGFDVYLPANAVAIDDADQNHMSLQIIAAVRTQQAQSVTNVEQKVEARLKQGSVNKIRESGITYSNAFVAPAGSYRVRFVVRDNLSGRVGSLTVPLEIKETQAAKPGIP